MEDTGTAEGGHPSSWTGTFDSSGMVHAEQVGGPIAVVRLLSWIACAICAVACSSLAPKHRAVVRVMWGDARRRYGERWCIQFERDFGTCKRRRVHRWYRPSNRGAPLGVLASAVRVAARARGSGASTTAGSSSMPLRRRNYPIDALSTPPSGTVRPDGGPSRPPGDGNVGHGDPSAR